MICKAEPGIPGWLWSVRVTVGWGLCPGRGRGGGRMSGCGSSVFGGLSFWRVSYFIPEFPTTKDCFIFQTFLFYFSCLYIRFLYVFIFPESIMINVLRSRKVLGLTVNQRVTPHPPPINLPQKSKPEFFNRKWERIVSLSWVAVRLLRRPNHDFCWDRNKMINFRVSLRVSFNFPHSPPIHKAPVKGDEGPNYQKIKYKCSWLTVSSLLSSIKTLNWNNTES